MSEVYIKNTHRGLRYEDGLFIRVLEPGRYKVPIHIDLGFFRTPKVEIRTVDMRSRDITIKGQEILTADKVAVRVSILVQFRVENPAAAMHEVEDYSERLYSDVQLAARRSLATMTLEEILTNRNKLSEDILSDVMSQSAAYGVSIQGANIKDLTFPGNLQEIMNRVITAERLSQAMLIEARTKAQNQQLEGETKAMLQRQEADARLENERKQAELEAANLRLRVESEMATLQAREAAARMFTQYPAMLRLMELETLKELAQSSNARLYISFQKPAKEQEDGD